MTASVKDERFLNEVTIYGLYDEHRNSHFSSTQRHKDI